MAKLIRIVYRALRRYGILRGPFAEQLEFPLDLSRRRKRRW